MSLDKASKFNINGLRASTASAIAAAHKKAEAYAVEFINFHLKKIIDKAVSLGSYEVNIVYEEYNLNSEAWALVIQELRLQGFHTQEGVIGEEYFVLSWR